MIPKRGHRTDATYLVFYGQWLLPIFRDMSREKLQAILKAAGDINARDAIHLVHDEKYSIPEFEDGMKLTGGKVMAIMVFGLYVLMGERDELCGTLLDSWPEIKMAKMLLG